MWSRIACKLFFIIFLGLLLDPRISILSGRKRRPIWILGETPQGKWPLGVSSCRGGRTEAYCTECSFSGDSRWIRKPPPPWYWSLAFWKNQGTFFIGTKVFVMVSWKKQLLFYFQDILNQDAVLGFGKNMFIRSNRQDWLQVTCLLFLSLCGMSRKFSVGICSVLSVDKSYFIIKIGLVLDTLIEEIEHSCILIFKWEWFLSIFIYTGLYFDGFVYNWGSWIDCVIIGFRHEFQAKQPT